MLTSTHNLCFEQKYKKLSEFFLSENFQFLEVKFSIYLNRRVFIMVWAFSWGLSELLGYLGCKDIRFSRPFIGVALITHSTHACNMRKKHIYNKVSFTLNTLFLYHRGCS